jgi:glycosyltransferase involved in cell wall biosynthesis
MSEVISWRGCFVIPTYNNPITIRGVVDSARAHGLPVIVVDDGSATAGYEACAALAREQLATVVHLPQNAGKGAAVKHGFETARQLGFTHAMQVDGDGQHNLAHVPEFVAASQRQPDALVLGCPQYDASVPKVRLIARKFTTFWVDLETGRGKILDAMIGFRIYPLEPLTRVRVVSDRMAFDIEIAVRLAWAGVTILNLPVRLRYLTASEGGISHFRIFRDNFHFALLHSRLCTLKCMAWMLPKRALLEW